MRTYFLLIGLVSACPDISISSNINLKNDIIKDGKVGEHWSNSGNSHRFSSEGVAFFIYISPTKPSSFSFNVTDRYSKSEQSTWLRHNVTERNTGDREIAEDEHVYLISQECIRFDGGALIHIQLNIEFGDCIETIYWRKDCGTMNSPLRSLQMGTSLDASDIIEHGVLKSDFNQSTVSLYSYNARQFQFTPYISLEEDTSIEATYALSFETKFDYGTIELSKDPKPLSILSACGTSSDKIRTFMLLDIPYYKAYEITFIQNCPVEESSSFGFFKALLILAVFAFGGLIGYRYWKGERGFDLVPGGNKLRMLVQQYQSIPHQPIDKELPDLDDSRSGINLNSSYGTV